MKFTWRKFLWISLSLVVFVIVIPLVLPFVFGSIAMPNAAVALGIPILLWGVVTFIIERRIESKSKFTPNDYDFATPAHKRYRQILIDNVRNDWIEDIYQKSLYHYTRIELGLKTKPEALDCQRIFRSAEGGSEELPPATSMSQVYRNANQHLLILGQPGSGKTTMLLELARDLLDEAEKDITLPVPVVLNLASWAEKRSLLSEWIVERLNRDYGVNHKLGKKWVAADQLLLLLDGLDEVREDCREACVEAINFYKANHVQDGLVVCSRSNEYEELAQKLNLRAAVELQPLTLEKAREYLGKSDVDMSGLLEALGSDLELQALAECPLMLNIMGLAYKAQPASEIMQADGRSIYQRIFNQYVQRMFDHPLDRSDPGTYTQVDAIHYLAWLARKLVQQEQAEFYLENLQPSWLESRTQKQTDMLLRTGLAVIIGLIGGLFGGLLFGLLGGLFGVLIVWLITALIFGLLSETYLQEEKNQTVNRLIFSWTQVRKDLKSALINGLIVGLIFGLIVGPLVGLRYGLIFGLSGGLIVGLTGGLSTEQIEVRKKPNQGTRNSLRNWLIVWLLFWLIVGLLGGMIVGLIVGLLLWLIGGLTFGLIFGLITWLMFGLMFGLIVGLNYGGAAFLNHYIIRFVLWRSGCIPRDYVGFLDYSAERILLRKKGGGYIFIHRMLMEYFAELDA